MNILILASSRDGIWLFYWMETWRLSALFMELCRLRWWCSSWPSQRWNSAFQTPNIPWFSQKIKRKRFSLYFLMCVVWQLHEEIGRHRDGDAAVWAALNSYGRCYADIGLMWEQPLCGPLRKTDDFCILKLLTQTILLFYCFGYC